MAETDDSGLAGLVAALDELRQSQARKPAEARIAAGPPLGGGVTDFDFTATLLSDLLAPPVRSATIARWIDELASARSEGERADVSARSLLQAYKDVAAVVVALVDALAADGESDALAALLSYVTEAASLHPSRRKVVAAVLDTRLLPLCKLAVGTPRGPLGATLASALRIAPSYTPDVRPLIAGAGPELLDLRIALNASAAAFWERLIALDPDNAQSWKAAVTEELGQQARNLVASGRAREAVPVARRAVATAEELASADPSEFLRDVAAARDILSDALRAAGG